ncbi:MAG: ornithine carbamoyltransferase [Phycisphaerales bacterium]|nr:ornithine carbamoyltransferase [Phycisphaerales bacterium]
MAVSLKGRSLVSLKDFSTEEVLQILETANTLKLERLRGQPHPVLAGKTLAMIFQKPSLRTRVSFESGMTQLGGHAIYLAPTDISIGKRETTEDIALVLSRYCDIIMARTFGHDIVVDLAKYATVPVINGLSDEEHPCQVLADLQTVKEKKGTLAGLKFVYVGDGNNMTHSLMYGCARVGMHMTAVTPPGYKPLDRVTAEAAAIGKENGCTIDATTDIAKGVAGADVVYTDVWASMGQETEAAERAKQFKAYRIDEKLMAHADSTATVLHCLPAHYDEEISYDVTRSPQSAIFDQAENRLHAQKALMVLLAGGR